MKEREELEKEVEMDVKDEKEQVSNQAKPNALALIPFIVLLPYTWQRHYSGYERYGNGILPVPGSAGSRYWRDYCIFCH